MASVPNVTDSSVKFLPQGALIQEFVVSGRNIVLGYARPEPYQEAPYFGETIGRVANRVKDGVLKNVNGRDYRLTQNENGHALHGGVEGWGKKLFDGPVPLNRNGREAVQFTYVSPDGEEGYPGTVELKVWYTAYEHLEHSVNQLVLEAEYEVRLVGNDNVQDTVVALTNHSFFNLSDNTTIEGTEITLASDQHLAIDEQSRLPTGTIQRSNILRADESLTLGANAPNIDLCFIVDPDTNEIPIDTRIRPLQKLVHAYHPQSRVHLEISSSEPAFQLYTGDYLDIPASEDGPARPARAGFCVEPGRYIDAINHDDWRGMVLLKHGQVYGAKNVYKAWTDEE